MAAITHLTDRRAAIMDAAKQVAADHGAAMQRRHEAEANAAIDACLPAIAELLESYGADPTTGITAQPCTDPAHALAWVTTAAGFDFEIVRNTHYTPARYDCWLLHPETGSPVVKVRPGIRWETVALALVDDSVDNPEPTPPAVEHPADRLVAALRDFIAGLPDLHREDGF